MSDSESEASEQSENESSENESGTESEQDGSEASEKVESPDGGKQKSVIDTLQLQLEGRKVILTIFRDGSMKLHAQRKAKKKTTDGERPSIAVQTVDDPEAPEPAETEQPPTKTLSLKTVAPPTPPRVVQQPPPQPEAPRQAVFPPPPVPPFPVLPTSQYSQFQPQPLKTGPPPLPPAGDFDSFYSHLRPLHAAPPVAAAAEPLPPPSALPSQPPMREVYMHEQFTQTAPAVRRAPAGGEMEPGEVLRQSSIRFDPYPVKGIPPKRPWKSPVRRAYFPELPPNFAQKL